MGLLDQIFPGGGVDPFAPSLLAPSTGFDLTPQEIEELKRISQPYLGFRTGMRPKEFGPKAGLLHQENLTNNPGLGFGGLLADMIQQPYPQDPGGGVLGAGDPAGSPLEGVLGAGDPAGTPLVAPPRPAPGPSYPDDLSTAWGGGGGMPSALDPSVSGAPAAPPDAPPSTNDPLSSEPVLFKNGAPLPRPRPAGANGVAPLSLAPDDYDDPKTGTPATDLSGTGGGYNIPGPGFRQPAAAARAAGDAPAEPFGGLFSKLFNPDNAPLWLALGSGMSGAPSFGTGLRRAAGAMVAPAALASKSRQEREQRNLTAKALLSKGVSPEEVAAAVGNPTLMKALVEKHYDEGKVIEVGGRVMRVKGDQVTKLADFSGGGKVQIVNNRAVRINEDGSTTLLADYSDEKAPTTIDVEGANGGKTKMQYVDGRWSVVPGQGKPSGKIQEVGKRLVRVEADDSVKVLADFSTDQDDGKPLTRDFKTPTGGTKAQQFNFKTRKWDDVPGWEQEAPRDMRENEKMDEPTAARLGMAKSFVGQLPEIRQRIEAGELAGVVNIGKAKIGTGKPGELRRMIDSGADALLRMLTGAGMNIQEANDYTRRYRFDPLTEYIDPKNLLSKMKQLERELVTIGEIVGKGRGGNVLAEFKQRMDAENAAAGGLQPGQSTTIDGVTIKKLSN